MTDTSAPSLAANGHLALVPAASAPARMAPLAVLPVFAKLSGRPVLVAGSGEGAAWKAELLAAAGANVLLVRDGADRPHCGEAHEIAARTITSNASTMGDTALPGTVRILDRPWTVADLSGAAPDATGAAPDGAGAPPDPHHPHPHASRPRFPDLRRAERRPALALIDTDCHAEAASFAALARDCGVTVNAIDKPMHCDVQFGSIVNRSPLVVGISTDGAAPILGQAIRRRIEAMLPLSLVSWAAAMARARARVLSLLPERAARRVFFERFSDAAQRLPWPKERDATDPIFDLAHGIARDGAAGSSAGPLGHVTLVGAGPGDAELLTLKAVRALQGADVVLFDALVSADVLELARREARRMLVGKRASRESCRQEDINALMLKLAHEGRRVVRLKSGDPMVFGRAGEELDALRAANVPYDVVPGITTAQALAASLGLSLTHRELARSVRFVTGHGSNGQLPSDLDWRGLADPSTTLVVYMGARTAALLAERLIREGMPPTTPAIAATEVARASQRNWTGTVGTLADGLNTLDTNLPTVIAVGDAVARTDVAMASATPRAVVAGR